MRRARRSLIPALALLVYGCSHGTTVSTTSIEHPGSEVAITFDGVRLEIDGGVRYRYQRTSATGRPDQTSQTIEGHSFGLSGGRFRIGDHDYGPAADGDRVRITPAGVTIRGEARGALPEPLADED